MTASLNQWFRVQVRVALPNPHPPYHPPPPHIFVFARAHKLPVFVLTHTRKVPVCIRVYAQSSGWRSIDFVLTHAHKVPVGKGKSPGGETISHQAIEITVSYFWGSLYIYPYLPTIVLYTNRITYKEPPERDLFLPVYCWALMFDLFLFLTFLAI